MINTKNGLVHLIGKIVKIYSKMIYMKKGNISLYEDNHPNTSTKGTGFKDKQKALDTLDIIFLIYR